MTTKSKELKDLIKILRANKVEHYEAGGHMIKFSPLAFIDQGKSSTREPVSANIDDDLFYSADKTKTKVK